MRILRAGAVVLTAVATVCLFVGSASASPRYGFWPSAGRTSVVIAPATAGALLSNSILPLPVLPGAEFPAVSGGSPTVEVSFPITGESVDLRSLTGTIDHSGGLVFDDVTTGKSLEIDDFDINLGPAAVLTAYVPALNVRVPIFDLSLAYAITNSYGRGITVRDIAVTLDPVAAGALDATLGTTLFTGGLPIGTASTELQARSHYGF
jgi:hypothetical protein